MSADDSQSQTLAGRVEGLTKISLPLLALIYVAGFVVVALHLARYGVSPLSLIEVQYIVAGIWLLLPLSILAVLITWVAAAIHHTYRSGANKSAPWWRRTWAHAYNVGKALTSVAGYLVISTYVLKWVIQLFPLNVEAAFSVRDILVVIGIVMVFGIAIMISVALAWLFLRDVKTSSLAASFSDLVWGTSIATFGLICMLGYIGYFTYVLYGRIPAALGGGAPVRVQFLLKKSDAEQNMSAVLKASPDARVSEPYSLLISTDKTYTILDPGNQNQAIEIMKESVEGIIFNVK